MIFAAAYYAVSLTVILVGAIVMHERMFGGK